MSTLEFVDRSRRAARRSCGFALRVACSTVLIVSCAVAPSSRGPAFDPSYEQELQRQAELAPQAGFGRNVESQTTATNDGVQVVLQSGHAQEIALTAMSNDGRAILTSSMDGTVKLWDVASSQELRTFSGLVAGATAVGFSADGTRVVISDGLQTYLFNAESGARVDTLGGSRMSFGGHTLIAPGGRYAATAARGSLMRPNPDSVDVVDLASGQRVWTTPAGDVQQPLALSANGQVLLTQRTKVKSGFFSGADITMEVQVWDVGSKRSRGGLPFLAQEEALGIRLVLSPDGRYVLADGPDRPLQLFALDSATPLATLAPAGLGINYLNAVAFSADGSLALRATDQGSIDVWQIPSGQRVHQIPGKAASFGPNGRTLVLGVANAGAPVIHDLATGTNTALAGGAVAVWDLTAIGGRSAAVTMQDGSTRLWDLATGQLQRNFDCSDAAGATSVATLDGARLAVGCADGSAWQWTLGSEAPPTQLIEPLADVLGWTLVRLAPDGRAIVARGDSISVRDAAGRELRSVTIPPATARMLAGNDELMDEEFLEGLPAYARKSMERAAAGLADPAMRAQIQAAANAIADVAIHPGGRLFVVARQEDITVWDMEEGTFVHSLSGSPTRVAGPQSQAALTTELSRLAMDGQSAADLEQLQAEELMAGETVSNDPNTAIDDTFTGASHLVFRNDGVLMSLGVGTPKLWDVSTGRRIRHSLSNDGANAMMTGNGERRDRSDPFDDASEGTFSPDGNIVALAKNTDIQLRDFSSGAEIAVLKGHRSNIAAIAFTPDGQRLLSGGRDGTLRVWSVPRTTELAQLIALGRSDYVAVTPDQYYRASKSRIRGVAFRIGEQVYPFEQFDLRFNRPDIVLERLGLADSAAIEPYRLAYERRLKKLGFTEAMLGTDFHLPSVQLEDTVPVSTDAKVLPITVTASDEKYPLNRLQVFVNDVPVFGTPGIAIAGDAHSYRTTVEVPLVAGRNKIQVSALNREGVESLRQTAYTNATGEFEDGDIYLVTIGVSQYANAAYNLRYAAKDAGDLASAYAAIEQGPVARGNVHVLSLTNNNATREQIRAAKEWLGQGKVGDLVIVFAAGHGMTDAANSYYFGTYDIDPRAPAARGLPYEDFEALLDGIPPLRKMLLIDSCFSGEIDEEEAVVVSRANDTTRGQVSMRTFKSQRGVQVVADEGTAAMDPNTNVLRFQQDWFADLRRGTGAVVISSASGNEYAFEGEQWKNGVFTYALLQGLKSGAADLDHNQRITVGELQAYVIEQVRELTAGGQNPTVRRENLDYDFEVY